MAVFFVAIHLPLTSSQFLCTHATWFKISPSLLFVGREMLSMHSALAPSSFDNANSCERLFKSQPQAFLDRMQWLSFVTTQHPKAISLWVVPHRVQNGISLHFMKRCALTLSETSLFRVRFQKNHGVDSPHSAFSDGTLYSPSSSRVTVSAEISYMSLCESLSTGSGAPSRRAESDGRYTRLSTTLRICSGVFIVVSVTVWPNRTKHVIIANRIM